MGSAVLRLRSFGTLERDTYVKRVDAVFASLPSEQPLVVDLRGNGGGDRVLGTSVLRHLIDAPFRQWSSVQVQRIPSPYDDRVIGTTTKGACDRHIGEVPILFETLSERFAILLSLADITMVPVPGCRPGHGFEPTEPIVYTKRHFLEQRDPYLETY